jgi:hypothetical protein
MRKAFTGTRCRWAARFCEAKSRDLPPGVFLRCKKNTGLLPLVRARGIAAESPQDLHEQIRGLGAESPVCGVSRKGAKIPNQRN